MYVAIIGDIIQSKNVKDKKTVQKFYEDKYFITIDRATVQQELKKTLDAVNKEYNDQIASNFTITLGDEFQGLLYSSKFALEIIDYIRFAMYPVLLRFGVGKGEMQTEYYKEISIGSDGPAYWYAREAINCIYKQSKSRSRVLWRWDSQAEKILSEVTLKNQKDETVKNLVDCCLAEGDYIFNSWTVSQMVLFKDLFAKYRYKKYIQSDAAKIAGTSQQVISRKTKDNGYDEYIALRKAIQELLR